MRLLALDLSKSSTGWACWASGEENPASGTWELGSAFTSDGLTYCALHGRLIDLGALGHIDAVFYEEPLTQAAVAGRSNIDTLRILTCLAGHVQSWAEVHGCGLIQPVPMATWRRHFLGKMPRATKSAQLKDYAMERCRQLGFRPRKHDEAEALGILDYACEALPRPVTPPWRAGEVLRPALGGVA